MSKEEFMPTEREWRIMDIIWEEGDGIISEEIVAKLRGMDNLTERTIRVLLSRLCKKGLLGYTVDETDSRVYHYYAKRTRMECQTEKSQDFIDHYFQGNKTMAIAALLKDVDLTDDQIMELEGVFNEVKGQGKRSGKGKK